MEKTVNMASPEPGMPEMLVITPVKDSLETAVSVISAVCKSEGRHHYMVFDDFSNESTGKALDEYGNELGFELVHLSDITNAPSPNYDLVLQMAQQKAIDMGVPLVIVESDVIVKDNTLARMLALSRECHNCGMIAAITVDGQGVVNFPYHKFKNVNAEIVNTTRSLSFCCTLLTTAFMEKFSFEGLQKDKDWHDVFISRKSVELGFNNYIVTTLPVIHKPHSSRPWKHMKYTNPIKYYWRKYTMGLDKI